jgi:nucleotidyltransferase/DNA polymerase involved in DNA repair
VYQKQEPQLRNKALALVPARQKGASDKVSYSNGSAFSRIQILYCSAFAIKKGVRTGMKLSEARAICNDLIWQEYDARLCLKYQTSLVKELLSCSPRIVAREPGVFLLDAQGRKHLGGENKLCRDILKLASKCGFIDGQIGIADTAFGALIASKIKSRRWFIVSANKDASFLSTLPITHLPLSPEFQHVLHELGVKTMGQLAQLPVDRVIARFGEEGRIAHELASGFDLNQPQIPVIEKRFAYRVELGGPIEALNQTMFVMKAMLDKLTSELATAGLCADELTVSFFSDEDKFDERPIRLINSSNHAKFLLEVLRLSLESQPLMREFTGIEICVSRHSKEVWNQPSITDASNKSTDSTPESLNLLLQRFITRLGSDALVKPTANDQYLMESSGFWQPVIQTQNSQTVENSHTESLQSKRGTTPLVENEKESTHTLKSNYSEMDLVTVKVNSEYIKETSGASGLVSNLVFKKNAVAVPVLIEFNDAQPAAIRYHGRWHYIKKITIPECLSGNWWENPLKRSYYTVLLDVSNAESKVLENPAVMSLFHDHDSSTWFVDGVFD